MRSALGGLAALALGCVSGASAQSFTDVTDAAGLGGTTVHLPASTAMPQMMSGVAVADFDRDGWDDIYWDGGNGQPSKLFRNLGDGTFADVAAAAGVDVQVPGSQPLFFDADDDGWLDLLLVTYAAVFPGPAIAGGSGPGAPFTPSGPGQITPTHGPTPGLSQHRNLFFHNNGDGTFVERTEEAALEESGRTGIAAGDIDGDGDLDLLAVSWTLGSHTRLLLNRGDGRFRDVTPAAMHDTPTRGFSPHLVDMDGDGDPEAFWGADFDTSLYFENLGDLAFADVTAAAGLGTDENGMGSTVGDYDNDGDLDYFVSAIYNEEPFGPPQQQFNWGHTGNRLYRNQGDGTFDDATDGAGVRDGGWGWGSQFADLDNDGDLDLIHTNGWPNLPPEHQQYLTDATRVFVNDGTGVFSEQAAALGLVDTEQGRGLIVFDHDQDGALDVVVSNSDVGLTLWRNDPEGLGHWLEVVLRGTETNSHGIGARITLIQAGGARQLRHVEAGSQFMSQSPNKVWFGLGADAGPVALEIAWPTGTIQHLTAVTVDRRVSVTEPRADR